MRIGITGGSGFLGGYVAEEAVRRKHDVVVFDRHRAPRSNEALAPLIDQGKCTTFLGDIVDAVAMTEFAAHVDGIIHLAATLGTQETIRNPMPAAKTNVLGGINFLESVAQYDVPGVYIGVGNHWMNNTYSISKTTVERFVQMYNVERKTRVNVVRAVNAYGPRQSVAPPFGPAKVRKITPAFVCRALTGKPIEIYGDGEQVSDMVAVQDVAIALVTALEKAQDSMVFDRAVEVGPSPAQSRTVNQIAAEVIEATTGLRFPKVEVTHLPMRPGEISGARVTADTTTLAMVDMAPECLLPYTIGIAETVSWFADNWLPKWTSEQESKDRESHRFCSSACNPGNCARKDF